MAAHFPTGAKCLRGHLLVATPQLQHSPFRETVVYLSEHDRNGAQGYVLNRPSLITVGKLMDNFEVECAARYEDRIWLGGPVGERHIHMLHTPDWYSASTRSVDPNFAVSRDTFMLEKLSTMDTPREWMMFAGFSAWAAGQLESELSHNSWLTLPANPAVVFSSKKSELWNLCVELCAQNMVDNYF